MRSRRCQSACRGGATPHILNYLLTKRSRGTHYRFTSCATNAGDITSTILFPPLPRPAATENFDSASCILLCEPDHRLRAYSFRIAHDSSFHRPSWVHLPYPRVALPHSSPLISFDVRLFPSPRVSRTGIRLYPHRQWLIFLIVVIRHLLFLRENIEKAVL